MGSAPTCSAPRLPRPPGARLCTHVNGRTLHAAASAGRQRRSDARRSTCAWPMLGRSTVPATYAVASSAGNVHVPSRIAGSG